MTFFPKDDDYTFEYRMGCFSFLLVNELLLIMFFTIDLWG